MTNISSESDFRMELNRRIKASLVNGLEDAGATREEIAQQEGDMIDLASIIAEDLGLRIENAPDGRVVAWFV